MMLCEPKRITSKAGKEWVIFEAISPDGQEFVQVFLTPEQVSEYGLASAPLISTKEFVEFLGQTKPVDVEFNARGRVSRVTL